MIAALLPRILGGYYNVKHLLIAESVIPFRNKFHTNLIMCKANAKYEKENGLFDVQVHKRRKEAQRSIIVQVQSEQSSEQLQDHCSQFGDINAMIHYTGANPNMHFILVEFSNADIVPEVMKTCGYHDRNEVIPTYSRMVWFRANQKKKLTTEHQTSTVPLTHGTSNVERSQLLEWFSGAENVSDQIKILHKSVQLDDLGTRLRYITAHQLETSLSGLFPYAQALLFGSSVNGFGRLGCDVDLVLQLDHRMMEDDSKCRLMFHAKPSMNARSQTQRHIDGLADLVQWFLPGCADVRRILQARVPIVKYRQELTNLECDLSLTNMTAVYMSELLFLYGEVDERLRPLVFTVRQWAAEVGLTNRSPGRWITNFSLTLLVIFYLQHLKILPSLDVLRQKARKSDRRISEDGVNCTFLRDVSKISQSNDNATLQSLLTGFFNFYAGFDFYVNGISLGSGAPVRKRDHSALYLTNPLETHLNVSQNVSLEETERMRIEFRNAAWELEVSEQDMDNSCNWGLLRLFKENQLIDKARQMETYLNRKKKRNDRLLPISKLFEEDTEESNTKSKSSENIETNIAR